ncbi:hypothetical protein QR680_015356 [Steinernema hermaphroditum]|uniref:F-box domain-containing protein n=1 Tax=Steinernema hermaphroditum TaxID=289476 RepID=A0AA39H7E5_9BILA|nr:hypothetical protein QR680_015356 [Steinernema hermaphroditum]
MGALCCICADRYKSDLNHLPYEVVYQILLVVSKAEKHPCLINRYRRVCRRWNKIIDEIMHSMGAEEGVPKEAVCFLTIVVSTSEPDLKLSIATRDGQFPIEPDKLRTTYPQNAPKRLIINKCDFDCPTVSSAHMNSIAELASSLRSIRELQLYPGEKYSYSPIDFRKLLNSCGLSLETIVCHEPKSGDQDHLASVKRYFICTTGDVETDRFCITLRDDHIRMQSDFRGWRYKWTPGSRVSTWPNPDKNAERKNFTIVQRLYVKLKKDQKLTYFQQLNSFDYSTVMV